MSERTLKVGVGQTVYCRGPGELNHVEETDAGVGTKSGTVVETESEDEMEAVQRSPVLDSYAPDGDDEEQQEEEKFDQWSKEIDSGQTTVGSEQVAHSGAEMLESPERAEKMNTERYS
jgi:hypothetical protein